MAGLTVIVMASGFSRRFGKENKLLIPLGSMTLIERTLQSIQQANIGHIILVTQYEEVANLYAHNPLVKVVMNPEAKAGISASIRLGIKASTSSKGFMFVPADQIFLKPITLKALAQKHDEKPDKIIIPVYQGIEGSPKIFPVLLKPQLLALTGDRGGRDIIHENQTLIELHHFDDIIDHLDIDTYDSYQRIREDFK